MPEYFLQNEVSPGSDIKSPGDIQTFRSQEGIERYFEPWYVDEAYLLLKSDGSRHVLSIKSEGLCVVPLSDGNDYSDLLRELLILRLTQIGAKIELESTYGDKWENAPIESLFKVSMPSS